MKNEILTIGIDLGNDAFKVVGPTKQELYILNLLAPWYERRVVTEDTRYPLNLLEVEVTSKNKNLGKYFVGGMAYKFNRGILKERTVADRHTGKSNTPETLIILLTSVALSLLKPNKKAIKEKIVLGTMLPTEEYFENHKENVNVLEEKLTGSHKVKFLNPIFKGAEVEFEVMGVDVQPEGHCAINAIMYDENGELQDSYKQDYSEHTILGFDIGALTSDITVLQNFELRTFFGIDKGTVDPLNRIVDFLRTEFHASIPRHKVDNALTRKEKLLIYGSEVPNFDGICKEIIEYEGRQLIDEFTSKAAASGVRLPDIGLIVFSGGGSLLFKGILKSGLHRVPMIFSENALMLNALGAWKNANKLKNQLDEDSAMDYVAITKEP